MPAGSALRPGTPVDAARLARIHRAARAVALPGLREPHPEAAAPGGLTLLCFQRSHTALAFHQRHGFRVVACRDAAANEEVEPDALRAWSPPPPDRPKGENA